MPSLLPRLTSNGRPNSRFHLCFSCWFSGNEGTPVNHPYCFQEIPFRFIPKNLGHRHLHLHGSRSGPDCPSAPHLENWPACPTACRFAPSRCSFNRNGTTTSVPCSSLECCRSPSKKFNCLLNEENPKSQSLTIQPNSSRVSVFLRSTLNVANPRNPM